jgi:DNA-binding PadR family transcriptional regulator
LYPVLVRLEDRGLITGRWTEKAGERRRRFYRLTAEGRKVLAQQRSAWEEFSSAVNQILGGRHA